jgi:transcriptional regulator with XRE-family HTH domain
MATIEQALASTLQVLREKKGLSQSEVASQLDITQTAVSYWENGNRTPSPTYLSCLSKAYDSTPAKIYEMSETDPIQERAKQLEQAINIRREKHGNSHKTKAKSKK